MLSTAGLFTGSAGELDCREAGEAKAVTLDGQYHNRQRRAGYYGFVP